MNPGRANIATEEAALLRLLLLRGAPAEHDDVNPRAVSTARKNREVTKKCSIDATVLFLAMVWGVHLTSQ
jgi:hypothetical protein